MQKIILIFFIFLTSSMFSYNYNDEEYDKLYDNNISEDMADLYKSKFENITVDQIISLKNAHIYHSDLNMFKEAFPDGQIDQIMQLIKENIDLYSVIRYKEIVSDSSIDQIIRLNNEGVNIDGAATYKKIAPDSTIDSIILLKNAKINLSQAASYKEASPDSSIDDIIRLNNEGVDLDKAARYKKNVKNSSLDQILIYHKAKIDLDDASHYNSFFHTNITAENIKKLKENNVSGYDLTTYKEFNKNAKAEEVIDMLNRGIFEDIVKYIRLNPSVSQSELDFIFNSGLLSVMNKVKMNITLSDNDKVSFLKIFDIDNPLDYIKKNPSFSIEEIIDLEKFLSEKKKNGSNPILSTMSTKKIAANYNLVFSEKDMVHDYTSKESIEKVSNYYIDTFARIFEKKHEDLKDVYCMCEKEMIQTLTLKNTKQLKKYDIYKDFKLEEVPEYDASCVPIQGIPLYYGTGNDSLAQAMKKINELMAHGKEAKGDATLEKHKSNSSRSPWNATSLNYSIANEFAHGDTGTQKKHQISTTYIIDHDKVIAQKVSKYDDPEEEIGVYRIIPGANFLAVVVETFNNYDNPQYFINTYATDKRKAFYLLLKHNNRNRFLMKGLFKCVMSKLMNNSEKQKSKGKKGEK